MNIITTVLRDLADAIDSGEFGRKPGRPEGFIPIGAPRPEIGPDEAWWRWSERTGRTLIEIEGDEIRIDRPAELVGVVRGPAMKEAIDGR